MKLTRIQNQGFTLAEMLLATAIGSLMLAAAIGASVTLQRSFTAIDNYFASHLQQVRIIDYLSRDVKRAYIVTSSTDRQTVTCTLPDYLVRSGDPDDNGSNVGTRRKPVLSLVGNKVVANYQATTVTNVTTSGGSATLSCPGLPALSSHFTSSNVGQSVVGTGLPAGTTIQSVSGCLLGNCSQATMSQPASVSNTAGKVTIGSLSNVVYSVVNQAIQRRENGSLTDIAASADNLIPETIDIELSNTEFTQSSVTFLPQFSRNQSQTFLDNARAGTTVFSLSYLRNRRRGDG
jgi:prepilin-type N-terminal cleavage/methylation domain-containing protein